MKLNAKSIGKGLLGTVGTMGIGGAMYGAHTLAVAHLPGATAPTNADGSQKAEADADRYKRVRNYSWEILAPGILGGLAAHLLRVGSKTKSAGDALAGAAGFSLGEAIMLGHMLRLNNPAPSDSKALDNSSGKDTTKGLYPYQDTGALMGAGDVGALIGAGQIASTVETTGIDSEYGYDPAIDYL